jgi:1-acyl-sn-glycerol-3-phosphate acyltransferase
MSRPPLWLVVQELLYRLFRFSLGWLVRLLCLTRREGHRRIPRRGSAIVAFNHPSFLDAPLISASITRPLHFMGKQFVFGGGVRSVLLRRLFGQIALSDRGSNADALAGAIALLDHGRVVALAPEGTRSWDGSLSRGRTGVAMLAYETGAPVYPVALSGTYEAWPRGRPLPRLLSRTSVIVGEPIVVARDLDAADDPRRCRVLTDEVMLAIARLLDKPYVPASIPAAPEDGR